MKTSTYNIQNDTDLGKASDALNQVLGRTCACSTLGSQLSVVQTRQDFTKNLVNTLTVGADNLVLAENEEGAKLLALNTRQQLSQTALSLASQADQGVLRQPTHPAPPPSPQARRLRQTWLSRSSSNHANGSSSDRW